MLGRLYALAEAETDLSTHQKRLTEIEAEVSKRCVLKDGKDIIG